MRRWDKEAGGRRSGDELPFLLEEVHVRGRTLQTANVFVRTHLLGMWKLVGYPKHSGWQYIVFEPIRHQMFSRDALHFHDQRLALGHPHLAWAQCLS